MERSFIITLSKREREHSEGEEGEVLSKNFPEGRTATIKKALDYLLDPREDEYNPAYNSEQRELRDGINEWLREAEKGSGHFRLMYIRQNGELSDPVNLDDRISDYDDIIRQKTERGQFGEETVYDGVDLIARYHPKGGR